MSPGKSEIWNYFTEQNRYMSSRIVYATCVFCHPAAAPPFSAEEWSAKTDDERKKHAADSGWLIGKVDRLIRHLVSCELADTAARAMGQELRDGRQSARLIKQESLPSPAGGPGKTGRISLGDGGAKVTGRKSSGGESHDVLGWLQTAKTLARDAGTRIVAMRHPPRGNASDLKVSTKSNSADLVTNADLAAQEAIFQGLSTAFPNHLRIGEESVVGDGSADGMQPNLTMAPTWIVDAIDGTSNYVCGLPDVAICIAFAIKGRVVIGVVYNPFRDEMFHAVSGGGAYLNDNPISVSTRPSLDAATVVCEWGYERTPSGIDAMLAGSRRLLLANVRGIRQIGSGALDMCYVACGRVDAVYCGLAKEGWKIWDYAAAGVIAEEAGAVLSDISGCPFTLHATSMACATPALAENFVATVKP